MFNSIGRFLSKNFLASLTGGLYYDSSRDPLINTIHLYLWTFFLVFPFVLCQFVGLSNVIVEIVYPAVIFFLFCFIKCINFYFHKFFDTHERGVVKEKKKKEKQNKQEQNKPPDTQTDKQPDNQMEITIEPPENPTNTSPNIVLETNETDRSSNENQTILQLDGTRDNPSARIRTETFSYIDEFGIVHTYEIPVDEPEEIANEDIRIDGDYIQNTSQNSSNNRTQNQKDEPPKQQRDMNYKLKCCGIIFNIPFDRRFLEEMFDRNYSFFEVIISICMATLLAWLSYRILRIHFGFLSITFIWLSTTCAHFSLLKSPQPDAHSPQHFNNLTSYSRAFYFILFSSIAQIGNVVYNINLPNATFYGIQFNLSTIAYGIKEFFIYLLMFNPLLMLLGWLPQLDTFAMVVFEFIHIHLFGGTGTVSLIGSLIEIIFDLIGTAILIGVGYYSSWKNTFGSDYISGIYGGLVVSISYFLSRCPSNPLLYLVAIKDTFIWIFSLFRIKRKKTINVNEDEKKLKTKAYEQNLAGVNPKARIFKDLIISIILFIIVTPFQVFDIFAFANPYLLYVLACLVTINGFIIYYLIPEMRKPRPWKIFKYPFLENDGDFGTIPLHPFIQKIFGFQKETKRIKWFILFSMIMKFIEKIIYAIMIISSISFAFSKLNSKFHYIIASIRNMRAVFCDASRQWLAAGLAVLIFSVDLPRISESFILDFTLMSFIVLKLELIILKIHFMMVYSTPNISYASIYHILLHPLGIPHTALTLFGLIFSAIISAPLYPIVGAPVWVLSYARAMKYWEKEYKTKRRDESNTKLSQSLGMDVGNTNDSNNLNSIFYEHLVVAIRRALPDAIKKGELQSLTAGDIIFIMRDNLNAMIHFIEVGNGFCTFQLRGLEFQGTICQDREVEALNNAADDTYYERGYNRLFDFIQEKWFSNTKHLETIEFLKMLEMRWQTWEVINTELSLDTYNVILNPAERTIASFEQRTSIVTYYVKCCTYYLSKRDELDYWISKDSPFIEQISKINNTYVDCDPVFTSRFDIDFDINLDGVSFTKFLSTYQSLIDCCIAKRENVKKIKYTDEQKDRIRILAYLTSLTARRALSLPNGTPSTAITGVFLERLHQLFQADYRLTSLKDEWVFNDMILLQQVIVRGLRMCFRIYQDSFLGDDFNDPEILYNALEERQDLVICHEGDVQWRESIVADAPELFSFRKIQEDPKNGPRHYLLMLQMEQVKFKVIKLNKESVRALWAAQQQELVFLGNETPERGSIQQMKQVLRNIINQCCDVPVGYPVFISPLTTAYW